MIRNRKHPKSAIFKDGKWITTPEYNKWYSETHKDLIKKLQNEYIKSGRGARRQRESYRKVKQKIFEFLGNECNNQDCPIPRGKLDKRCLQIDHINGNGETHREKFRNLSKDRMVACSSYYKEILEELERQSKDYQLLCPYCNWRKRYL